MRGLGGSCTLRKESHGARHKGDTQKIGRAPHTPMCLVLTDKLIGYYWRQKKFSFQTVNTKDYEITHNPDCWKEGAASINPRRPPPTAPWEFAPINAAPCPLSAAFLKSLQALNILLDVWE